MRILRAGLATVALLLMSCSGQPVTVNGVSIANANQALNEGELLADGFYDQATLCFFSLVEGTEIAPYIRCRPLEDVFDYGFATEPYIVYELELEGGNGLAIADRSPLDFSDGILEGERLSRPDGKPVPASTQAGVTAASFGPDYAPIAERFQSCMLRAGFRVFGVGLAIDDQVSDLGVLLDATLLDVEYEWPRFGHESAEGLAASEKHCLAETAEAVQRLV